MLEFDTGGNVRFEEGRPGDVWFSSCADLVKSRVVRTRIVSDNEYDICCQIGMLWVGTGVGVDMHLIPVEVEREFVNRPHD